MTYLAAVAVLLTVLVNGFTDAPGAIAGVVLSHRLSLGQGAALGAVGNLTGCLLATACFPALLETVAALAPRGAGALTVVMLSVALWGTLAWVFGIPTSESHALVAALCGVDLALEGLGGLDGAALSRVGWGLFLSTFPAAVAGALTVGVVAFLCRGVDRRRARGAIGGCQVAGAALSAFFHGAQDGQKMVGILLCLFPHAGRSGRLGLTLLCAGVLSFGTALGGGRILRRMGRCLGRADGVRLCCGDLASGVILCICSLLGLPVSTTHVKSCAAFGAGRVLGGRVEWREVAEMAAAWVLTVPGCLFLGWIGAFLLRKGGML